MRSFYHYLYISLLGGFGYCLIEIIWRGRTHYSMFFAGAIVLSIFYYISSNYNINLLIKCIAGTIIITSIELIFGLAFNIMLKEHVWDYSEVPLNFLGQICLPFSMLWFILSGIIFTVIDYMKRMELYNNIR